jgi:hypothetical protein
MESTGKNSGKVDHRCNGSALKKPCYLAVMAQITSHDTGIAIVNIGCEQLCSGSVQVTDDSPAKVSRSAGYEYVPVVRNRSHLAIGVL